MQQEIREPYNLSSSIQYNPCIVPAQPTQGNSAVEELPRMKMQLVKAGRPCGVCRRN